jgi:hypothetical protein
MIFFCLIFFPYEISILDPAPILAGIMEETLWWKRKGLEPCWMMILWVLLQELVCHQDKVYLEDIPFETRGTLWDLQKFLQYIKYLSNLNSPPPSFRLVSLIPIQRWDLKNEDLKNCSAQSLVSVNVWLSNMWVLFLEMAASCCLSNN